jgi:hypothetical protein
VSGTQDRDYPAAVPPCRSTPLPCWDEPRPFGRKLIETKGFADARLRIGDFQQVNPAKKVSSATGNRSG